MKKFSFLTISFLVVGLCACISSGYFLSSVILSSNLFQNTSLVSCESTKVYAISLACSENKAELSATAESLQSKNGAGFVYEEDGKFFLLASAYDNINDAELVKNNLKLNSVEAEILTIERPKISIEGNFNMEEKEILQSCLKVEIDLFKSLYDVAISLDTAVLDKSKAKLECNNIFSSFVSTKTNFETFFSTEENSQQLVQIKGKLDAINNSLSCLISENYETSSQTFSSLIKQTYCEILFG